MLKSCACFRYVRYPVQTAVLEIFQVNFSEIDEIDQ